MQVNILSNKKVNEGYYKIKFKSPTISKKAKPGQFVMIKVTSGVDPLLRRPMSISRVDQNGVFFEILFKVVGKGTKLLSQLRAGEEIDVFGPIGKQFNIRKKENIFIVGGGIGISPLLGLAEKVTKKNRASQIQVIIGGKTKKDILCEKEFKTIGIKPLIATEDGSYGNRGFVTKLLISSMKRVENRNSVMIYACGPNGMLKAVHNIAEENSIPCQISIEKLMACGTGSCLGCVIKIKNPETNDFVYKTVCKDGPVFNSEEVIW